MGLDWSNIATLGGKANNILSMVKDYTAAENQPEQVEKGLFDKKEKEEIEKLNAELDAQKKKSEQTMTYVLGGLVAAMLLGFIKIGK